MKFSQVFIALMAIPALAMASPGQDSPNVARKAGYDTKGVRRLRPDKRTEN